MLDNSKVYAIIYALAALDGRQEALFGNCAPLAHEAFTRSCAGGNFPELWFELPLAGEPWFDLHALTSRKELEPGMQFSAGETGGHPELFEWFASADGVRQLALSYDISAGNFDNPATQLLARNPDMHVPFLELAGGKDAAAAYSAFAQRLPGGWFPCYTGVFAGRDIKAVRVECIPEVQLQNAYAQDAHLLEAHLSQAGLGQVSESIVSRCQLLARMPFHLEFQFDVLLDGTLGDTLGASSRFAAPSDTAEWDCFDVNGAAGELMELVEGWGLADARWRQLAGTIFAKGIAHGGQKVTVYCYPAFLKLRWCAGEPLDAKTYLIAGIDS